MSERTRFTAWVTKYALTEGILKMLVEDIGDGIVRKVNGTLPTYFHDEGREWHRTHEAAIVKAKQMQAAKLRSLDKQRVRIAALKFDPKGEA